MTDYYISYVPFDILQSSPCVLDFVPQSVASVSTAHTHIVLVVVVVITP